MTLDHINAVFEAGSALFIATNVRRLYLDKRVRGVNIMPTIWFSLWGLWNLVYYYGLGQWYSWAMGALVFWANSCWVMLALIYRRKERKRVAEALAGNATFDFDFDGRER